MTDLTIGAGYVKALLDLAASKGASRQTLLRRAKISSGDLENRDNRIPLDSYQLLMAAAKSLCEEPALALLLGEASSLSDVSIVGLICKCSSSNVETFQQINRFGRLVVEVDGHSTQGRFKMKRNDREFWMVDTRSNPNRFPELTESAFAMMITMQVNAGFPTFAKAVHFTHKEPNNRTEYDRVINAPIVFESDKNAILIDVKLMSLKLPDPDGYAFGVFSEKAEALLLNLQKSKTVKGQVESLLIPILHTGKWSMKQIAETLGFGRQTLYRRLKAEDTNFEKLTDELRHKMAVQYLDGKKASVNEVAYLTGYSEPSAFSRAYKRWTGKSPTL
ncbi:MAG: AraC-like DNA-binding protein [Candidatus Azotimanducaceae bacterium]